MALTFDANYYLTHRSDVFQAFVATAGSTGLTWAQFAELHYNNHGRFEGSNPNAVFNTNEYLAANPDVAAAGVNPFEHYLAHGVYEGRAPSASFPKLGVEFDADAYLAANPDLGEAGIDTAEEAYAHFVMHGQFEDRPGAPVVDTNPGDTFTLTTDIGENVVGTERDDTFNIILGTGATLNTFDTVNGRGGNDTANIVADAVVTAAQLSQLSNVENVRISQSFAGGQTAIDISGSDLRTITFEGTTGLAAGAVVTVGAGQTVNASLAAAGALAVTAATGVTELTANGVGANVNAFTFAETSASVTTVNAGGETAAAVTVTATATTETVNLSLEDDVTLTLVGGAVETLDMSASTGDITTTLLANIASVNGGSGDDSITDAATAAGDVAINLGAGSDTLTIANGDAAGATTITLGAGNDLVDVDALANINTATEADFDDAIITITDFNVGEDKIDVSGVGTVVADNLLQGAINAATSLYEALEIAGAGAGGDVVFQYGSDTYVYANNGDAVVDVGEGLLKLTGISVSDLGAANFVA